MSSFVPQRGWAGFIGLVVLVLAFVVAVPNVRADDNKVTVSVVAILATDQNEKVEKKLTGVAAEVQKLNQEKVLAPPPDEHAH